MQPARPGRPNGSTGISKSDKVLKLLRSRHGATVPAIMEATTWQAHTVRGFLSGTIKKRLKLDLTSEVGKDVVRRIREWSEVPILVLSVRQSEAEKVALLDAGANDYVVKPFQPNELLARVRRNLKPT